MLNQHNAPRHISFPIPHGTIRWVVAGRRVSITTTHTAIDTTVEYGIEVSERCEGKPVAFKLTKDDGTVYEVFQTSPSAKACTCTDAKRRRMFGTMLTQDCKHVKAITALMAAQKV